MRETVQARGGPQFQTDSAGSWYCWLPPVLNDRVYLSPYRVMKCDFHQTFTVSHLNTFQQFHVSLTGKRMLKEDLAVPCRTLTPGIRLQLIHFRQHGAGTKMELQKEFAVSAGESGGFCFL